MVESYRQCLHWHMKLLCLMACVVSLQYQLGCALGRSTRTGDCSFNRRSLEVGYAPVCRFRTLFHESHGHDAQRGPKRFSASSSHIAFIPGFSTTRNESWMNCERKLPNLWRNYRKPPAKGRGHLARMMASGKYDHGQNPNLIIGGDVDSPPGLFHSIDDEEIRTFSQEMWNKGVTLEEAVERLNLLDGVQPTSVMENFLYANGTNSDANDTSQDTGYEENQHDPETGVSVAEKEQQSKEVESKREDIIDTNSEKAAAPITDKEGRTLESSLRDIPGYVAPPEYIDEHQYRLETGDGKAEQCKDSGKEDTFSDEEHPTGIDEVNYSALSSDELQLVSTLMHNRLEDPGSHDEILNELLSGGTGGLTEEQCRSYFDRFIRIGEILMDLNKTVGMSPLNFEWIPRIQELIREFVESRGCQLASIKWTADDVIVSLKAGLPETKFTSVHEALSRFIATDVGIGICAGMKKVGLLMYTELPKDADEITSTGRGASK